jgi:hypothetical protein
MTYKTSAALLPKCPSPFQGERRSKVNLKIFGFSALPRFRASAACMLRCTRYPKKVSIFSTEAQKHRGAESLNFFDAFAQAIIPLLIAAMYYLSQGNGRICRYLIDSGRDVEHPPPFTSAQNAQRQHFWA